MVFYFSVTVYQKDANDKSRNRKSPCFYCSKEIFNPSKHLQRKHKLEPDVKRAAKKLDRGDGLHMKRIILFGVFNHNIAVLKKKEGLFYVARSSDKSHYVEDYLPCSCCMQFVIKRELYRHCKRCKLRNDNSSRRYAVDGRLVLDGALLAESAIPKSLSSKVLCRMKDDALTKVARKDISILKFGASLLRKLGPKRANDIAQRMRQLARLSMRLAKMSSKSRSWAVLLDKYISGSKFDRVIAAVCVECDHFEDDSGRQLFGNPNLALKLGHSLIKLAKLKLGDAIRTKELTRKSDAEDFITLHSADFTDVVSTPAHASNKVRPKRLDSFPDSSDLLKLKNYQMNKSQELCELLLRCPSKTTWRHLAEVLMSRLIVFNGRRGSEVGDLRVVEYDKRSNLVHSNVKENMTDRELELLNT